jgi:septin family protein
MLRILSKKVNVVPVIAKADGLLDDELDAFKDEIMYLIYNNKVPIYPMGIERKQPMQFDIERFYPMAIIGCADKIPGPDGQLIRGRAYPWGHLYSM